MPAFLTLLPFIYVYPWFPVPGCCWWDCPTLLIVAPLVCRHDMRIFPTCPICWCSIYCAYSIPPLLPAVPDYLTPDYHFPGTTTDRMVDVVDFTPDGRDTPAVPRNTCIAGGTDVGQLGAWAGLTPCLTPTHHLPQDVPPPHPCFRTCSYLPALDLQDGQVNVVSTDFGRTPLPLYLTTLPLQTDGSTFPLFVMCPYALPRQSRCFPPEPDRHGGQTLAVSITCPF